MSYWFATREASDRDYHIYVTLKRVFSKTIRIQMGHLKKNFRFYFFCISFPCYSVRAEKYKKWEPLQEPKYSITFYPEQY